MKVAPCFTRAILAGISMFFSLQQISWSRVSLLMVFWLQVEHEQLVLMRRLHACTQRLDMLSMPKPPLSLLNLEPMRILSGRYARTLPYPGLQ
jgi:hypothetical protein